MRGLLFALALAAVLVPAAAAAQVVFDGTVWRAGATCPPGWAPTGETRPMLPDTYFVDDGGIRQRISQEALNRAYTTAGQLNTLQRDQAIAAGVTVRRLTGRSPQIRCQWRPLGGQP